MIAPSGSDEWKIKGCVLGFFGGGESGTRVAPPIPSSPANSMAKGAAPKTAAPLAPKTTGTASAAPAPKTQPGANQKMAAQAAADTVGDICLLPDIARVAH